MKTPALLFISALLGVGAPAMAKTLDYSYSRQGGTVTANWSQSDAPAPTSYVTGAYTFVPVAGGVEQVNGVSDPITSIEFASFLGGAFEGPTVGDFGLGALYSGPESAPVFSTGVFQGVIGGTLTVVDAPAGVPEPRAWTLFVVGVASLGLALRKRTKIHVREIRSGVDSNRLASGAEAEATIG